MNRKFKNIEDLSDSNEELHPNIDSKSFRRFIKEQNQKRLEELLSKKSLTNEEKVELEKLQYKNLPVDIEIPEDSFRISKEISDDEEDLYIQYIAELLNDFSIENLLKILDNKVKSLENFEDLIYMNCSEQIKAGNDEIGLFFCKLGLLTKWAREYGRSYLLKLIHANEKDLDEIFENHYKASKQAILSFKDQ